MQVSRFLRTHPVRPIALAVMVLAIASLSGASGASAESGRFTFVIGRVEVQSPGSSVPVLAKPGTEVNRGDTIITYADGMAQLTMVDEARLSLRSNSRLRVETYSSRGESQPPTSLLNLLRGTLRAFTSALTSNKDNYKMRTAVATVGIRGSGNVLNQSDDDSTTTNHTIEGEHSITANEGNFPPVFTHPNQTVQVIRGQAPKFIPTPLFMLDAGKTMVGSGDTDSAPGTTGDDGQSRGVGSFPGSGAAIVGGNGLGFPDTNVNAGTDPINLQNIVIASNGTAFSDQAAPEQIRLDAGALRAYSAYAGAQSGTSIDIKGGNVADLQTIIIDGGMTIVLGRWTGVSSLAFSGGNGYVGAGGIHWGYGGTGFPAYLSDVLTGTVSYTRVGATTPTNQLGTTGQLVNTILDVNFTSRTLNATLGITMPTAGGTNGGNWTLQATNVPFALNSFIAFTGGGGLTVTNGTGQSSASNSGLSGTIDGSFVGSTLNGALVGYGFVDQTGSGSAGFQSVSGVVAFQGPSQNAAAQYRDGLVSDPNGALSGASYIRSYATTNRPEEVSVGDQGRVTAFTAPYVAGNHLVGHVNYAQGTSTIVDNGFDPTTGLVWGRWSGGAATIGGQSANLTNSSLHYIFSPTQNGPVSLPLTGTAVYDVVGSTRPTDGAGHTGTMNAATLAANFSARTVDTSVNIGINGQTWNGAATGVPIYRDQYFSAYGGGSIAGVPRPSLLTITCAPNCTPALPTGSLDGFFTGRTGSGAGVMYNLGGNAGAIAFAKRGR
ncbi:MAG: FecR domain-containing protein [Betaproteobacteria bacterium]|nr:FecR domain-containing protein [Betaproteobacteria bacterium]